MTIEACSQVDIPHQSATFAKHTNGNWKDDDSSSFSTAASSFSTSPDMSSIMISPVMRQSSSSLTLTHLPQLIDDQYKDQQDLSTVEQLRLQIEKQEREIAALKVSLAVTHKKWQEQIQRADEAVSVQQQAENEIEELSAQLFEQANLMVSKERRERYAADEQTERITQELERTRELLHRQQSLRSHIIAPLDLSKRAPMMDIHDLTLFRDFVQRVRSVSLDHMHQLPFVKHCLEQDIYPCLQRMEKLSSRRLLHSLSRRPCMIECKTVNNVPFTTFSCFACGAPGRRNQQDFQFRMNDADRCWHRIDRPCKDRLVAISNFYEFIRHLHVGLQGQQRSIESLFHEMVWLRLYLFWTRSGIMNDGDITAESVIVSISRLFDTQSFLF
ncbi:hypothetical protein BJV82DRAFT_626260 [Fennellomyces sp. T-0311]|nr:hypothetical protein BJV82DRAFT_626260 [Fennellomyces sp. T-0311]